MVESEGKVRKRLRTFRGLGRENEEIVLMMKDNNTLAFQ